jgi:alpha-L-arabinofuranosidase
MKNPILVGLLLGTLSAQAATLRVDPNHIVREVDRHRFLGTNVGLWHEARQLFDTDVQYYLRDLNPSYLRIPGGSWSDAYIWNGNGVWDGNTFDLSKYSNGVWQIDYSKYAPGFLQEKPGVPAEWHGNLDVLALHEFVKDKGSHAIVTVNAGTGTPEMAAEWVRWANLEKKYGVKYWEVGNELEGGWEMGSTKPDGTRLTGKDYAERFNAFAKAMKAVDPTIKVGGPTAANTRMLFLEDLMKYAGDEVDFISFHTYPVERGLVSEAEVMEQAFSLKKPMDRIHKLIEKYQPSRKGQIEIGITEWNSKVVEDRDSADLLNGLWSSIFVGEMFRQGVGFATQWDLLTATPEGGHGLFDFQGRCQPKSQYWALYMWSKYMGNQLLDAQLQDSKNAYAIVTRDSDRLYVMVVNISRDDPAEITIEVPGAELSSEGRVATLSHREYFWDYLQHNLRWSRKPHEEKIAIQSPIQLKVSPFSVKVIEIPFKGKTLRTAEDVRNKEIHPIEILLPESAPADLAIEGWVFLPNDPKDPKVEWRTEQATLSVEGPATINTKKVPLDEAAGRFFLQPTGSGKVMITAEANGETAKKEIHITPVQKRNKIVWEFENAQSEWGAESDFELFADDTVRPNQKVAAVRLKQARPSSGKDRLALFSIPDSLPKERIAGVVLKLGTSSDFTCAPENSSISVVLQSETDHWIPLGTIPLAELKGTLKEFSFSLPDTKYYKAMGHAYSVRLQFNHSSPNDQPMNGLIYIDDLGFILR